MDLANALRSRMPREQLNAVRDKHGGLMALMARFPTLFVVDASMRTHETVQLAPRAPSTAGSDLTSVVSEVSTADTGAEAADTCLSVTIGSSGSSSSPELPTVHVAVPPSSGASLYVGDTGHYGSPLVATTTSTAPGSSASSVAAYPVASGPSQREDTYTPSYPYAGMDAVRQPLPHIDHSVDGFRFGRDDGASPFVRPASQGTSPGTQAQRPGMHSGGMWLGGVPAPAAPHPPAAISRGYGGTCCPNCVRGVL